MNPLFTLTIQLLQALNLLTVFQSFIIGVLGLALLFAILSFFRRQ